MTTKLHVIRWLGSIGVLIDSKGRAMTDGVPAGVLHIGSKVFAPGDEIKSPEDLEALGAARIQELVDEGQAQYLDHSPKPLMDLHGEFTAKDRVTAEKASSEALKYSAMAAGLWKSDFEKGFIDEAGELTKLGKARLASLGSSSGAAP
jgi:hypothetical protein